eukprot:365623-Chlamydomonas_euryale.AAC.7
MRGVMLEIPGGMTASRTGALLRSACDRLVLDAKIRRCSNTDLDACMDPTHCIGLAWRDSDACANAFPQDCYKYVSGFEAHALFTLIAFKHTFSASMHGRVIVLARPRGIRPMNGMPVLSTATERGSNSRLDAVTKGTPRGPEPSRTNPALPTGTRELGSELR